MHLCNNQEVALNLTRAQTKNNDALKVNFTNT